MDEYFKKLDEYIDMKIEYKGKDLSYREKRWLQSAKTDMEIALYLWVKSMVS